MKRAVVAAASEIVGKITALRDLYLVGIRRRGVPLAERLAEKIEVLEGTRRFTAFWTSRSIAMTFPPSAPTR